MTPTFPVSATRYGAADRIWWVIYAVFFLALSVAKAPRVLIETRFWAEEGQKYFAQIRMLDAWHALVYVTSGNYQLLNNAIVYFASKAPLVYAPAVTTYSAFLIEGLVAVLIGVFVSRYGINRLVGLALIAAWVFMPATYETWASATNVQWVCSVSMLLVLVLPQQDIARNFGKVAVWTGLCGLTGVPSCMLAPGFLARAFAERSRCFAVLGGVLIACGAIQLAVIASHTLTRRSFTIGPGILTIPALLQTVLAPLIGVDWVEELARPIREGTASTQLFALVYLAGVSPMLIAIGLAWRARHVTIVALIASLWVLVSILNTFGAVAPTIATVSALSGARYFLFGAMCFCLLLALGTTARSRLARVVAIALLGTIVISSVAGRASGTWSIFYTEGPSWADEVAKCDPDAPCQVAIWPPGWTVKLAPRSQSAR